MRYARVPSWEFCKTSSGRVSPDLARTRQIVPPGKANLVQLETLPALESDGLLPGEHGRPPLCIEHLDDLGGGNEGVTG
jgi:hypothetical protein